MKHRSIQSTEPMKNDTFANKFKEQPKPVEVKEENPIISDKVFIGFIITLVLIGAVV